MHAISTRKIGTGIAGVLLFALALYWASPHELWQQFRKISPYALTGVVILAAVNLAAMAFRFLRVLRHCEVLLPWPLVWRACTAGNLASLAFIPLLAQVAGRHAVLSRHGVSPVTTASIAALERVLLAGVSAAAAVAGAAYLLGQAAVQAFANEMAFLQLLAVIVLAAIVAFGFTRSPFESQLIRRGLSRRALKAAVELLGISVIGHSLILAAFVVAFASLDTSLTITQLIAGAAIVSFAASMPLSVGGWGVREFTAVMVYGQMGVDAATAMAGSVTVGLCSTLAILLTSGTLLRRDRSTLNPVAASNPMQATHHITESTATWLLSMTTVALVFFQVHLKLNGHVVNVNMGDPFAMLALAALALLGLSHKALPSWTMKGFNIWLIAFSVALVLAFALGVARFGITPWALGNKLTGWLVLLGYLSAGYLLARDHGRLGVIRMIEVALAVVCVIVWVKLMIRATPWFPEQLSREPFNFEGFSGNRNAFAFQICAVLALVLGYLRQLLISLENKPWPRWALIAAISTILAGVVFTGSRTGMGVAGVLLAVAFVGHIRNRKPILAAVLGAALIWFLATQLPGVTVAVSNTIIGWILHVWPNAPIDLAGISQISNLGINPVGSHISTESSDNARWAANREALKMWLSSPWLGGGLGSFLHGSEAKFGHTLTIHSTPLWILAEFGTAGLLVMAYGIFIVCRHFFSMQKRNACAFALALLLLAFALFSQLHEMLYQRTLWLFMGALLAVGATRRPGTHNPS